MDYYAPFAAVAVALLTILLAVAIRRARALALRCREAEALLALREHDLATALSMASAQTRDVERASREAEASDAHFRQIVETASEGIWVVGSDGLTTYVNARLAAMLGYEREELLRRPLWDFLSDEGRTEAQRMGRLAAAEIPTQVEAPFRMRSGALLWASLATSEIKDRSGAVVGALGILTDVTDRRRNDEELRAAKRAAEAASAAKTAFLAVISHEIRTPLAAILGFTDILRDRGNTEAQQDQYLATIARNGRALSRLIDDVLDLSKVEAGKLAVDLAPTNLDDLAQDLSQLFGAQAADKGLRLAVAVDGDCPPVVHTDAARLRQILVNLVGNALKFTPQGEVSVRFRTLKYDDRAPRLAITVSDSGIGIPADAHHLLFQSFSQADGSITRRFGGTGLGLALSRRLARALGGDVVLAESAAGRGSVFEVSIDAASPAESIANLPVPMAAAVPAP